MTKNEISSKSAAALSQNAALLAFLGAVAFLVLLIILHVIEPEFDPSWRLISEYELGHYGWMMSLAFISFSASIFALIVAIRSYIRTTVGRIGLFMLSIIGAALIGAAIFITDPITTPANAFTTSGNLHNLCGAIVILGFPIAITLIGRSLSVNQAWASIRRRIPWITIMVWSGLLVFYGSYIIFMMGKSGIGPDVLIGWPNRYLIVVYILWVMIVAGYTRWRASMS